MPCGAGNGLTKNLRQNRSQPSKEQSRDNCEEGNGKPPHPLPSQETWQKNSQRNLWCWTVRPSGRKAPCQKAPGDEHSAVPIRAILLLSFSGRADEAVELKPSGRSYAEYALKRTALGWKGKRKVYGEGKRRMEEKHKLRVGTSNVRTMNAMGKMENVKE